MRPLMMHEAGFVGMAERGTIRHKHSAIFIVGFPGERARIRAGGWNCQKSFELRYPSSWNSSRAARGSRLKPENQARYLRNEKGSCGPQPLSLWNNLPPDEIVCMTFSPPIPEYKWDPNSCYYCYYYIRRRWTVLWNFSYEIFISLIFRISFFLSNFLCIDCKILQWIFF